MAPQFVAYAALLISLTYPPTVVSESVSELELELQLGISAAGAVGGAAVVGTHAVVVAAVVGTEAVGSAVLTGTAAAVQASPAVASAVAGDVMAGATRMKWLVWGAPEGEVAGTVAAEEVLAVDAFALAAAQEHASEAVVEVVKEIEPLAQKFQEKGQICFWCWKTLQRAVEKELL